MDAQYLKSDGPRPFPMDALKMITNCNLTCEQQKAIALLELEYIKNCATEQIRFCNALIEEINKFQAKV
jgi:hypothetical protein